MDLGPKNYKHPESTTTMTQLQSSVKHFASFPKITHLDLEHPMGTTYCHSGTEIQPTLTTIQSAGEKALCTIP